MASEKILNLTDDNFSEAVNADKPVLVDFWAAWCGPCRRVIPILDELAEERDDVTIAKVNVDDNQGIANRLQVQSLPSFLFFHKGELVDRMMGAMPKSAFVKFIDQNLEQLAGTEADVKAEAAAEFETAEA